MNIDEIVDLMQSKHYLIAMGRGKLSRYLKCSKDDITEARRIIRSNIKRDNKPRILLFDLEVSAKIVATFGVWNTNIYSNQILQDSYIISYSANWLGEDKIISGIVTSEEAINADDYRIVQELWELYNEAEIVIAYNLKKYDDKQLNSRFLVHKFLPPQPYRMIDPLQTMKSKFGHTYNKMDYVSDSLGLSRKEETEGMPLWISCMEGDKKALDKMLGYNKQDIIVLKDVTLALLPWMPNMPNAGLYSEKSGMVCSNISCGSSKLEKADKYYYTNLGKYEMFRCKKCGSYSKGRKSIKSSLLAPVTRY